MLLTPARAAVSRNSRNSITSSTGIWNYQSIICTKSGFRLLGQRGGVGKENQCRDICLFNFLTKPPKLGRAAAQFSTDATKPLEPKLSINTKNDEKISTSVSNEKEVPSKQPVNLAFAFHCGVAARSARQKVASYISFLKNVLKFYLNSISLKGDRRRGCILHQLG